MIDEETHGVWILYRSAFFSRQEFRFRRSVTWYKLKYRIT